MWICAGVYLLLTAVYVAERRKKKIFSWGDGLGRKIFGIMVSICTLALILEVSQRLEAGEGVRKLQRNGYGEGQKEESLKLQIEGEKEKEVTLQISPREYSHKEVQALFRQAIKRLDDVVLGENESADCVEEDLSLPAELEGFPFTIIWGLSRYDVMDMTGHIDQEAVKEAQRAAADEQQGILVTVTGILRYKEEEAAYNMDVRIFAKKEKKKGMIGQVMDAVGKLEEESREAAFIELPQELEGRKVTWHRPVSPIALPLIFLGIIGSILLICLKRQEEQKRRKERREQMLLDYPEIVSQITMLMGAGLTVKNAWKKVTGDYSEQKAGTGRERAAYEEMLYTLTEMQSGIPESECYERFARRCEAAPYMKLGALLSQNLRKGAKGTAKLLIMEAIQAMEEQKSRARRLGEEAGTKLLLPMLLMLIIVLTIVIVPAFLSASL
ncbi:hypothetical protein ABXS75_01145 [Roseburia hominis]